MDSVDSEEGLADSVAVADMRTALRIFIVLVFCAVAGRTVRAQDVTDDGRVGAVFAHPTPLDKFSGVPYVWFDDQTGDVKSYRIAVPNIIYHATPWLQGWGGLIVSWKDDESRGNTRELRPYVGVKVFLPNSAHIHLYDWTRFEWRRITNTDKDTTTRETRFRTRPGIEFPLSTRAWQPGTFYGLANGELFMEHDFVNAVRFMSGGGYITNDRLRVEFQYVLELSRNASSDARAYADNSFRLELKWSFKEGLLHKQEGPE